eukprot:TRINITY_DN5864_c0_g1_i4.p1 TRINITY_DN5864_c0_g1~~TRINITY_DN5864_c0_g1_i4.p1  ORF type:complete len:394 (+),score=129.44 TRINITY_DN5864_c0_g1_i4:138-1319(+)
MSNVNIGKDKNDPTNRYTMPRIRSKIEGRGNGIKTVILNMEEIAKALTVDPEYPTKFLGIELGSLSKFDRTLDRAIVNGAHDPAKLAELLEKFIGWFVLCPQCELPEITWKVDTKRQVIRVRCAACGHDGVINHNHKLETYILKNPPVAKKKVPQPDEKPGKRRNKKGEPHHTTQAAAQAQAEPEPEPEETLLEDDGQKETEDVEWFTDTSKEAQRERRAAELHAMGMDVVERVADGIKKEKETPVQMLRNFINAETRSPKQILAELRRIQLARSLDEHARCRILVEALFDVSQPKTITSQITTHAALLKQVTQDRLAVSALLAAFEDLCGVIAPDALLPRFPLILQALYEQDVFEEEVLLAWYDSPPESSAVRRDVAVQLRQRAEPFIKWLQ